MHPVIAIPITLLLVIRSYRRKSLTLIGILAATLTALIHALYPSSVPFTLLVVFFLLGTTATKVKHDIKATLTVSSTGATGGEGARTSVQVLANSAVSSLLIILHVYLYGTGSTGCFGGNDRTRNVIMIGIISNYAAVTADTLSSELGILSKSKPRLITAPWKIVPPGTNGGVTAAGLIAGAGGSLVIGLVSATLLDFCGKNDGNLFSGKSERDLRGKAALVAGITTLGIIGTVLDSVLGAVLQASVVDKRTGKVVEGAGGYKVLTSATRRSSVAVQGKVHAREESRKINTGRDILDNNGVNFLMAALVSVGGMLFGASAL